MITAEFHPSQWLRILQFLRTCPGVYVGQEENCRRFLTGTLWIARTGAQWRALPTEYGQWNTVYKRFLRWCERGVWKGMHEADPDMEHLLLNPGPSLCGGCAAQGGQGAQWAEAAVFSTRFT